MAEKTRCPAKISTPALTVNGVKIPLGSDKDQAVHIAAEVGITLPSRIALPFEGVIATEIVWKRPNQVTPVEMYCREKEDVALCEAVMKATRILFHSDS